MLNRTALFGSALALGVAGAAFAQDDMAMSPQTMTCADIAELDEAQAEGAIYFAAGYESAQGFGGAMGTGGVTGVTGTAATTDSGAAGTTTPETGAATGTDTTAGVATGTDTGTEAGTGMGTGTGMMNFRDIQVSEILSACEDSPDQLVSAVLREHAGGAGNN